MATSGGQIVFDITADDSSFKSTMHNIRSIVSDSMSGASSSMSEETSKMVESARHAGTSINEHFRGVGSGIGSSMSAGTGAAKTDLESLAEKARSSSSNIEGSGKRAGDSFGGIGAKAVAAGQLIATGIEGAVRSIINFTKESLDAYNEVQSNITIVQTMGANLGWTTEQLEKTSRSYGLVSEDMNLQAQKTAISLGMQPEIYETLGNAIDQAAEKSDGLNVSSQSLAKAAKGISIAIESGSGGALKRYGIVLDSVQAKQFKADDEQQRAVMIQQLMAKETNGLNQALLATPAGSIKNLTNNIEELKVSFGGLMEGSVTPDKFMESLTNTINAGLNVITQIAPKIINAVAYAVQAVAPQLPGIINTVLPTVINAMISLVEALIKVAPTIFTSLVNAIPQTIGTLIKDGDAGPLMLAGSLLLAKAFGPMLITTLVKDGIFKRLAAGIAGETAKATADAANSGGDIVQDITNGGASNVAKTAESDTAEATRSASAAAGEAENVAGNVSRVSSAMKTIQSGMVTLLLAAAVIASFAAAIWLVDKAVPSNIGELVPKLLVVGAVIVGMAVLAGAMGAFSPVAGAIMAGAIAMTTLSVPLIAMTLAIGLVNMVIPTNLNTLIPKFVVMGEVLLGMIALGAVFSLLSPVLVLALIGITAVTAMVSAITVIAAELKLISIIKLDHGAIQSGLNSIQSGINTIIGGELKNALGLVTEAVAGWLGVAGLAAVAASALFYIAIALELQKIGTIKLNNGAITSGLKSIRTGIDDVISEENKAGLNSVMGAIGSWLGTAGIAGVATAVLAYDNIADNLKKIASVQLDSKSIKSRLKTITDSMNTVVGNDAKNGFDNILGAIGSWLSASSVSHIASIVKTYTDISVNLKRIADFKLNPKTIAAGVKTITDSINAVVSNDVKNNFNLMAGAESTWLSEQSVKMVDNIMKTYNDMVTSLKKIDAFQVNPSDLKSHIAQITQSIDQVVSDDAKNHFNTLQGAVGAWLSDRAVKSVADAIRVYSNIVSDLEKIATLHITPSTLEHAIDQITSTIQYVFTNPPMIINDASVKASQQLGVSVQNVQKAVGSYAAMVGELTSIQNSKINSSINNKINDLVGVITNMNKIPSLDGKIPGYIKTAKDAAWELNILSQTVNKMTATYGDGGKNKVDQIREVIQEISRIGNVNGSVPGYVKTATDASNQLGVLAKSINRMESVAGGSDKKVSAIVNVIREMNNIPTVAKGFTANLQSALDGAHLLSQIATAINAGASISGSAMSNFTKMATQIVNAIKGAIDSQVGSMREEGAKLAQALIDGINSRGGQASSAGHNLQRLFWSAIQSQLGAEQSQGVSIASQFVNGINSRQGSAESAGHRLQDSFWRSIQSQMGSEYYQGVALGQQVINGLNTQANHGYNVGRAFQSSFWRGIQDQMGSEYSQGSALGNNVIQGLNNALRAGRSSVAANAQALANQIKSGIAVTLQIHSPSQVMYDMGNFVVQGLANGIADNQATAVKAATNLSSSVQRAININPTESFPTSSVIPMLGSTNANGGTIESSAKPRTVNGVTLNFTNVNNTNTSTNKLMSDLSWELGKLV